MKFRILKRNCKLVAFFGALFFMPRLSVAGNVIGSLPYVVTSSGNYQLQSNLTYAGQRNAIEVEAANVLINLNGFSITNTGNGVYGVLIQKRENLTIRNGTISGFQAGVVLAGSQSRAVNLQLVKNVFGVQVLAGNSTVQDCFIIGTGTQQTGNGIQVSASASGVLVKGNQVSEFIVGIVTSGSGSGSSAFVGNYIANSTYGPTVGRNSFYQGNVVTNCTVPFTGGNAIGTENGGD